MDEFLLIFRLAGQLPTIALAHVFTSDEQPHRFVFKVFFLLLVELPSVHKEAVDNNRDLLLWSI